MPLLESVGELLRGSQVKARLVHLNQKEKGFGKLHGSLIWGHTRGRPWAVGEAVYDKGCWGSHVWNLHLFVTLLLSRTCVYLRGLVILRPLQTTGQTKWMPISKTMEELNRAPNRRAICFIQSINLHVKLIQKQPHKNTQIMFDQISELP